MADLARDERKVPIQVLQPSTTQVLAYTGTAAISSALVSNVVRVVATTACHVIVTGGVGVLATTSDMYLPANVPEYFEVSDIVGDSTLSQISVIQNASGGNLYITEMV